MVGLTLISSALASCLNFAHPQRVTERCEPDGAGEIDVVLARFFNIFHAGDGVAIYVCSCTSVVTLRSDVFLMCSSWDADWWYDGGCACLLDVMSGSGASDCCATKCGAYHGAFCCFSSANVDAAVRGLAAFDWKCVCGSLYDNHNRVRVSDCNFTKHAVTTKWRPLATAIYQRQSGSSTNASFTIFDRCVHGSATLFEDSGNAATLRTCLFVSGCAAITHGWGATGQDVFERCFFSNTIVGARYFPARSVLLRNCLFAAAVPSMPANFLTEGVQLGFASSRVVGDDCETIHKRGRRGPVRIRPAQNDAGPEILARPRRRIHTQDRIRFQKTVSITVSQ
jgi:hypothetical protein